MQDGNVESLVQKSGKIVIKGPKIKIFLSAMILLTCPGLGVGFLAMSHHSKSIKIKIISCHKFYHSFLYGGMPILNPNIRTFI